MEAEKRPTPWVAQLAAAHLLLQRPHLLFSENKRGHSSSPVQPGTGPKPYITAKPSRGGGNSGIFEITKPDLRKATAFKKLADS